MNNFGGEALLIIKKKYLASVAPLELTCLINIL